MRRLLMLFARSARVRDAVLFAASLAVLAACTETVPPENRVAEASGPVVTAPDAPSPLGNYLAANHAQQVHDYVAAARFVERALANDPENFELVRRAFVLRLSEGRVDDALPLARRIVDLDGNRGLAAVTLLIEDIKAGNLDGAAGRAKTLTRDGAQRYAVPLLLAWVEAGRHRPAQAVQALDEMGPLRGLEPLRNLHEGLLADFNDRTAEAQQDFDKLVAAEQQPTYRIVQVAGNFYERRGRPDAAKHLYENFTTDDDETGVAKSGLARIAAGQIPDRLITTPQQGAAEALFDLASLLDQRDTIDISLVYARLALELEPDFALAQLLVAEIRGEEGRTDDALALYRAVDPKSPLAWSARLRAALAEDALDHTDEAITELRRMAAERPDSPSALVELGDVLRGKSRFDDAAKAYDEAIGRLGSEQAKETSWRLFYDRGVAYERSGQWPRAEADLKRALQLSPEQAMVLNYLGYSWIDKGENLPEALKMIQRAVELRPNDGYIVDSLGWAYYRTGDLAKATQFLERAIELLPEDPTINDHLGDVYWRTGRVAEARYQWRRALQFGPDPGDAKSIEVKLDRGLEKPPQAMSGG
ncbi:MAG TPA: tetratricopeptide repeat protein [Stellaceae bacterium]|nr:tetratricopeptide repeat protein [Stellaceae bacterium]